MIKPSCHFFIIYFVLSYRVKFEVTDGLDNALFVIDDADMKEIIGIDCEDMRLIAEVRYMDYLFGVLTP